MPTTKSAKKRLRQSQERRLRNRSARSTLRTHIRRVLAAVTENDPVKAREELRLTTIKLDRAGTRGLIHRNKAARIKSRLVHRIKALETQA